ncbi:MAG: hypothetical protein M3315_01115 [Actinomycetota bacterium]|nr:hypothetical protein [Actinomycetota bacterium]
MLEQIGNPLPFTAHYTANGQRKVGLTDVTVDVYRGTTLIVTAAAATEVGAGLYRYVLAGNQVTVEEAYSAVFKTADATVDSKDVPSQWLVGKAGIEHLDADVSSRAAPGAQMTLPLWMQEALYPLRYGLQPSTTSVGKIDVLAGFGVNPPVGFQLDPQFMTVGTSSVLVGAKALN